MEDLSNVWVHFSGYATYIVLILAIISLWIKRSYAVWGTLFIAAVIVGFLQARLQWLAIPSILALALLCYLSFKKNSLFSVRLLAGILLCILSLLLGLHQLPGFNNLKVLSSVVLSPNAYPYSLYFNFDKAMIGIFILGFGWHFINQSKTKLNKSFPASSIINYIGIILLMLLVMLGLSLAIGYVTFDVKATSTFWVWAIANLFFTCIPEEAFFRGFIQNALQRRFEKLRWGGFLACLLAAFLFGLAHFAFGLKFMFLAFVAGLFYGWVYQKSQRLEASIIAHFILNATHFLFFSYPALLPNN